MENADFNYKWKLSGGYPAPRVEKHNLKVFSAFACGGGSSMGYKLAGYDVIGCSEIDKKMMEVYQRNHSPKYYYLEDIKITKERSYLPEELYSLDILDGSPPCSSFSIAGGREKTWGKSKKFREGQSDQVLDTLFFDFIELAEKLQPKVILAENVPGILLGDAIKYTQKIIKDFESAGYYTEFWRLNSRYMGVPQSRERVFFISLRKDIAKKIPGGRQNLLTKMPYLDLRFDQKEILFKEIKITPIDADRPLVEKGLSLWGERQPEDSGMSDIYERVYGKSSWFNFVFAKEERVLGTLIASGPTVVYSEPRHLEKEETILASSFPLDFNFMENPVHYICGMAVPPLMIANIAYRIYQQWLSKLDS